MKPSPTLIVTFRLKASVLRVAGLIGAGTVVDVAAVPAAEAVVREVAADVVAAPGVAVGAAADRVTDLKSNTDSLI